MILIYGEKDKDWIANRLNKQKDGFLKAEEDMDAIKSHVYIS